jgi:hypothetical protein
MVASKKELGGRPVHAPSYDRTRSSTRERECAHHLFPGPERDRSDQRGRQQVHGGLVVDLVAAAGLPVHGLGGHRQSAQRAAAGVHQVAVLGAGQERVALRQQGRADDVVLHTAHEGAAERRKNGNDRH